MTTIEAARIAVDCGEIELFNHVDGNEFMWAGGGERTVEKHVRFTGRFREPPAVNVAITTLDASKDHNLRVKVYARDIGPDGFKAVARTWGETKLARISVTWMAFGNT